MNRHINKTMLLGLLMSFMTSASPRVVRDFHGTWEWREASPNTAPYATLSLDIKQDEAKLSGVYCYVARSGSRIDCPDEDWDNVSGSAMGESALLTIRSTYFDKNFKARVELTADSLRFNVVEPI